MRSACVAGPRILRRDATDLGSVGNLEPFQMLFADPPYGKGLGEKAMAAAARGGWLEPGAIAVTKTRRRCRFGRSFLSLSGKPDLRRHREFILFRYQPQ